MDGVFGMVIKRFMNDELNGMGKLRLGVDLNDYVFVCGTILRVSYVFMI